MAKDDVIQQANTLGSDNVVRNNEIGTVHGLGVIEYADLQDQSENLAGVAAHKSALAIASRLPEAAGNSQVNIENVTDPDTGFSIQLREWYEAKEAKRYLSCVAMYGVAKANANALHRIASA